MNDDELNIEETNEVTDEVVNQPSMSDLIDQGVPLSPEETATQGSFAAPFQSPVGNSSVDLTQGNNEDTMMEEYKEWYHLGRDRKFGILPYNKPEFQDERNQLREKWYQKYHGMDYAGYLEGKQANATTIYGNKPNLEGAANQMDQNFQALMVPGLAYADFTNDALGTVVPGYDKIDDRWDAKTKLDNPLYQNMRKILSVVLPAIHAGGATNQALANRGVNRYPWLQKHLTRLGAFGLADGAVTVLSDTSEDHNAARFVADMLPGVFGSKGRVPLPNGWVTLDSDSPAVRKQKNFYESGILSTIGTILGAFVDGKSAIKTKVDFIEPLDAKSAAYKQLELFKESNPDDLIELQRLNTLVSSGKLNRQTERQIMDEIMNLEAKLGMDRGLEARLQRQEIKFTAEQDAAARRKLAAMDEVEQLELGFDGDITPGVGDVASEARQSVPPANVARNMADTTAIKNGTSQGDPAPIMTEAMREKGLMVGSRSRDAVMGVAEETRDIGRFNAVVDGIRYSTKQMNAAAWDIYTSIIAAENLDDVKALFYENRDVKNFLMGRFKVDVMNEEQARAAAFALRDLTDRFLGREVSEASARVMDTLGRESSTLAEAIQKGGDYVDENRVMDLIIDKMQFLLDEYALNKYLSGWSLRNKNWFDQVPPKELDTVIEQLTKEFTDAENAIHARNLRFTETLKETKKLKPHFLRPLVDAYAHTNGDVDTLVKLNKWAQQQVSPMGMIKSPDPKEMNLFAKSAWSVVMNNVLSGLSAFRAGVGNTYALVMKPITAVLGHGIWGASDGFEGLKRTVYTYGSIYETNRRALSDGFEMMKRAHKDPEMMIKAYRKDFTFQADKKWDIMEEMRGAWETEGNFGKVMQFDAASLLRDLGRHPALRYGMTGLVFPDAYTSTMLAHWLSRVKAYDDVFSEFGFADWTKIHTAEANHYKNFFDANGLIKDDVLRSVAGEIQLNLDDGLANWINKGTNAYPVTKFLAMFPRTSSNYIKASASWTPLSLIPGFNKYSKTIYARTSDDIAQALAEHGIDMATTPNARVIFENLRAEYTGRLAFSTLMVGTLHQYAMGGNIRGNGNYNASRRKKERDNFGYEPKTINIGGKWVSYKGIWGIEQVLSIMGDIAYYSKDLNEPAMANWEGKLAWTLASSFLNETPLQGFEPLIAATNGDMTGWNRLIANTARSFLPMSGGAGVLANAIDGAQKNLEGEVTEYIANRLPGFKNQLPDQIDLWTGDALNDIDNPFLRILNAMSPIKVSGTREDWRVFLETIQYDGLSRLKKDSTGSVDYAPDEVEWIMKDIASRKPYKFIQKIMKDGGLTNAVNDLAAHRTTNTDLQNTEVVLKKKYLPIYKAIDAYLRNEQQISEQNLLRLRPDIATTIQNQQIVNSMMKKGNVKGAAEIQKRDLETQQLLQFGGKR